MVDCAVENQIVADIPILNFLRHERNERLYGRMLPHSEREILMKHSPFMAGLYIDYMKLLDDYKWQILIDAGEVSSQVLKEVYTKFASWQDAVDKKRVGLFIDYENIIRGIQGMNTRDVGVI